MSTAQKQKETFLSKIMNNNDKEQLKNRKKSFY